MPHPLCPRTAHGTGTGVPVAVGLSASPIFSFEIATTLLVECIWNYRIERRYYSEHVFRLANKASVERPGITPTSLLRTGRAPLDATQR